MSSSRTDWDERYSRPGSAYGDEPNDFLREARNQLRVSGRVLCLGEGEGRNAIWLAREGFDVTAVDLSPVGLSKAERAAVAAGVKIRTIVADLDTFDMGAARWDAIVSIWCHMPSRVRRGVHARAVDALAPGGCLVVEAYAKSQVHRGTGGPKDPNMCLDLEELLHEAAGLRPIIARSLTRRVEEGEYHSGESDVTQFLAHKPALVTRAD